MIWKPNEPSSKKGKISPEKQQNELSGVPAEGFEEMEDSEEADILRHEKRKREMPISEVQKIIDELNREDEEQKKHEQDVDNVIDKKHKQGY